ncbi:uncharacterized protein BKA55DRAFT_560807 [Fusarium redolens]|uniref:Uncharacterized protein n=1 Tax=Fusarium redolens TaxID=48865 RepID=A0A9P9HPE5_FUSRE|nr:uncharacterized protein BKA55DRAFT_560807 [Fusarium redolens]KAH7261245.1 hypothetical protein BKA55DRAFT_560807 [Fusarium redolens]
MLEKEAALVASRQQERQLSMELQSIKNEISSYKNSRKSMNKELADAKKDLEQSRGRVTEQSTRLQEANDKVRELSKELERSKQEILDMGKASEQAGRNYQSLWSRYNRLQESNQNNQHCQQSTAQWPPLPSSSRGFRFDEPPQEINPIFDFRRGAYQQGSHVDVAQRFGTPTYSTAKFGTVSTILPGGSRSFSFDGSSQPKTTFNGFGAATLQQNPQPIPPSGTGNQKRQQDNQPQQGAADPKRLKRET